MKNKKCINLKKRLSIILIVCMLFQISPMNFFKVNKVFAATGLRHQTVGNDVVLGGNYIEVGVSKSGSFGTASTAPSGFHPTCGGVGLRVDGDGFDTGNNPTTGDFFLPGTPEESFTIGYKVGSVGVTSTKYTNAERVGNTDIPTVTTDTSSSDTLSALTTGTTKDNNLTMKQNISFKVNDKFFKNTVTYTNKGTSTLYDVRYMRSFDPDQDSDLYGNSNTKNQVIENFAGTEKRAIVKAAGGTTGDTVFFISMDNRARCANPGLGLINRDPYDLRLYNPDGAALKLGEKNEDSAIAITFSLGNLEPGQSTTFEYYTSLDPDYNAGLADIMGSIGLQINNGAATTNSLNVTLNLSGQNVAQMRLSNDNSSWSPWESYASTKAWTLTAGDGTKTVYAQFKDSADNISSANASIIYKDNTAPTFTVSGNPTSWTNSNVIFTINASDDSSGLNTTGAYSFDGGSTWTTSNSKSFSSNGIVKIKVRDNSGNISSQDVVIDKIDKAAPTFTSITSTPSAWTSNSVNLTVNGAADNGGAGLNTSAYSFSTTQGEYNWQESNVSPSFSENQSVYVYVRDSLGNISSASTVNIANIDKVLPVISSVTGNPSDWTSGDVKLIVNASDALSGLPAAAYSFDGGITWQAENTKTYTENKSNIVVKVKDAAGNIAAYGAIDITKIDKAAPTITSVTGNPSDWTSGDVKLAINASDALSGLPAAAYSFDGGSTWQAENTKTYTENTSNIAVKVKDVAGNIAIYSPIDITKIDKTAPNTAVIANSDKYSDSNWYNNTQTVTASFTGTAGCIEKLQYKVNTGAWTDGESVTISDEGKHDVSFRVVDGLGRASAVQTVKVNVDKTAPTNAKITVKDREFTSILNTITFGIFFKETVNVSITADGNISGIKTTEYQKVAKDTDYKPDGTWKSGSSFDVNPDEKFIVYAKITDNAGNYVVVNSDGVIVDSTNPDLAVTPDASDWTSSDVNVKVEAADKLAGVKEVTYTTDEKVPQAGTVAISDGTGIIKLSNEGQYKLTVTAKDNSDNEVSQNVEIKIDRTMPKLVGASEASSYFVGKVIKISDDLGEIAEATYKKDKETEISFSNDTLFEKTGNYALIIKDKAGNVAKLSFAIKAMPKVEDVIYTADCKALIDSIRAEFDSHSDLPEPYKTNTDNEIKALEARYAKLHKEVMDIKSETSVIKCKVDVLPKGIDGLISLQKEIQDEYNKIAGNTSTLTKEQKLALEKEAEYLKQQLDIITQLQSQIDAIKIKVSSIDTNVDGLISKEGKIKEILSDIDKLTKEQKNILQPQIDMLNGLVSKINVLKEEVETVKGMINKLPSAEKVTKADLDQVTNAEKAYNKLTNEQKGLVGDALAKRLSACLDALRKIMLHNEENDLTVTGIEGTTFDSDVYLVVTPIKTDSANTNAKFTISAENVKKAAETTAEIKNKELVALYDVSLFKDNIKVQPDGKVKVKIKIPEELKGRSGLDIVHIADDGTVTPMHAVVEDGYLVFITTHFSEYAIVAVPVAKAAVTTIPKTGSVLDLNSLVIGGVILTIAGLVVVRRKRRKA